MGGATAGRHAGGQAMGGATQIQTEEQGCVLTLTSSSPPVFVDLGGQYEPMEEMVPFLVLE